jgi:hypothetical protein
VNTGKEERMPDDRKTSIELPRDLWRRVRVRAAEEEVSLKELLARALEAYLKTKLPARRAGR